MKIFVAAPFSDKIDPKTGTTTPDFTNKLKLLLDELRSKRHNVICAHEREQWGLNLDTPDEALDLDFKGIENSDCLVALLGNPPSPGVQMELGAAIILRKPIICLIKKDSIVPYLVMGIHRLTKIKYIEYETIKQATQDLINVLSDFEKDKI